MNAPAPLARLSDAPAETRRRLREQFVRWLEDPAHEALQITGALFAAGGPACGCCAVGGLMTVLQAAGYARIDGADATVRIEVPGLGVLDAGLGAEGLCEATGELPEELAGALGLGLSLNDIAELNDGPCVPHAFWEIAAAITACGRPLGGEG